MASNIAMQIAKFVKKIAIKDNLYNNVMLLTIMNVLFYVILCLFSKIMYKYDSFKYELLLFLIICSINILYSLMYMYSLRVKNIICMKIYNIWQLIFSLMLVFINLFYCMFAYIHNDMVYMVKFIIGLSIFLNTMFGSVLSSALNEMIIRTNLSEDSKSEVFLINSKY